MRKGRSLGYYILHPIYYCFYANAGTRASKSRKFQLALANPG